MPFISHYDASKVFEPLQTSDESFEECSIAEFSPLKGSTPLVFLVSVIDEPMVPALAPNRSVIVFARRLRNVHDEADQCVDLRI